MIMTMTVVGWGVSMGTRCVIIYWLLWRSGRFIIVIFAVVILFYYEENSNPNQVWQEIKSTTTMAITVLSKKEEENKVEGTMIYSVYSKSPYFGKYSIDNLWRLPSLLDMHLRRYIETYSYSYYFLRRKKTFLYSK